MDRGDVDPPRPDEEKGRDEWGSARERALSMSTPSKSQWIAGWVVFAGLVGVFAAGDVRADPSGSWKRPNGDMVQVSNAGGKLSCKIMKGSKPGFEMCNGMTGSGSFWKGSGMKHPDMPGFMTFNGTVQVSGSTLSIKGCAIGESLCDSETWSRWR